MRLILQGNILPFERVCSSSELIAKMCLNFNSLSDATYVQNNEQTAR